MTRTTAWTWAFLCVLVASAPGRAQTPRDARLLVTVTDPSGGIVPGATVTVTAADPSTRAAATSPRVGKTTDKGLATLEGLPAGRYSIQAEYPGFDAGALQDVRIRSGDNKHIVVLPLKKLQDTVSVTQDRQIEAADPRGSTFATQLTREQIDALSDDPAEMAQQLQDMAGGNATIRVDSFLGGELPPKAMIKSIHIVRDTFAAEMHGAESDEIRIITQPGVGPMRGGGTSRFRSGSLNAKSPFAPTKGPEFSQTYEGNLGGTIVDQKSSFSVSMRGVDAYDTPLLNAALPSGTLAQALNLKRPTDTASFNSLFDYALTRDQVLRLGYQQSKNTQNNLGVGGFDLAERAYSTGSTDHRLRVQVGGPMGRRTFGNTRLQIRWRDASSSSALEAPTIIVNGNFTRGGAQVAGGRTSQEFEAASDIDYIRGLHSFRFGFESEGGRYRSDDTTNYLGTYTFTSVDAFSANRPSTFTRRIGDPLIQYWFVESGVYAQDDLRLSKALTLSPGVRFEAQTHVRDYSAVSPRFGITWAPSKSGRTTIRASIGRFSNWVNPNTYEQTLRVDGFRQQELDIMSPNYPDSGTSGVVPLTNRYLLGDVRMVRTTRLSAGVEHRLSPKVRVSALYSFVRGANFLRGTNLNPLLGGVRPDPRFANVIDVVSDADSRTHLLVTSVNLNLAAGVAGINQQRFNPRRLALTVTDRLGFARNNTDGPFTVSPTGTLATEWGPAANDLRHRLSMELSSQALRNFSANLSLVATSGTPYTITTGFDTNGDSIFNDRPDGVGRNSARAAWGSTLSGNFTYTIGFGGRPAGGIILGAGGGEHDRVVDTRAAQSSRYRVAFVLSVANLTNRSNYAGYSGVMTSYFFMQPTAVLNPRRVDFGMNFSF